MDLPLKEKTAVITGAGSGIGRAIALAFADAGARLILVGRTRETLEETARLAGNGHVLVADVSDEAAVSRMAGEAGPADILVNNAGTFVWKRFTDLTTADWDRTLAVNLRGVFLCCRAFVPGMIARKAGVILNLGSIHGLRGGGGDVNVAAQCASKSGVIGLTEALSRELKPYQIRVNAICPGSVDPMADPAKPPLSRRILPEEVARIARFLASDEAAGITGASFEIHGATGTVIRTQG
jgi:NAD(P)-dependent dehydrogenase (short-subunit alcohol dehydrogenase family)